MTIAKHKITSILTIIMMVLTIILAATPTEAQAANKKAKALKAYKTYLTKVRKEHPESKFALAYVNKDKVPELFILYKKKPGTYNFATGGFLGLYTCKKNKITPVDTYFKDNGHYFYYGEFNHNEYIKYTKLKYYKKTGTYLFTMYDGSEHRTYYYNTKQKPTSNTGKKIAMTLEKPVKENNCYRKYINGNEVTITKSAFNKYIKKITKGKKATTVKFVKNTAKNAKKKLK